jgi:non-canonical (house-cleaning) NTP pyrophosphatase
MNVYVITESEYKRDAVKEFFENKYSNLLNHVKMVSLHTPSFQCFEEEIEYQAYSRIQQFLQNQKNIKKPDDWVVGIQTGLIKFNDDYMEVTYVLVHYMEKTYCLDSKMIMIPNEYKKYIYQAQTDREKIFQIYDQTGFENRRKEVIKETFEELIKKMFHHE